MTVLANDPARRRNCDAIHDLVELGWLRPDDEVLDLTLGPNAGFWTDYQPPHLLTNDANPCVPADLHHDGTRLPFPDSWCDVTVWDCDYGYRGTSEFDTDAWYGIDHYRTPKAVDAKLAAGTREAVRVTRRLALLKCQDSNVASTFHDQQQIVTDAARDAGANIIGKLYVNGVRAQPAGKTQLNVWGYWSVLLIARKR